LDSGEAANTKYIIHINYMY